MRSLIPHNDFRTLADSWWQDLASLFDPDFDFIFASKGSYPKLNIHEDKEQLVVEAAIPGLTKDQVKVEYKDGLLSISGRSQNEVKKGDDCRLRELHKSSFTRTISIPEGKYGIENIVANLENGLLTITIPKLHCSQDKLCHRVEICEK